MAAMNWQSESMFQEVAPKPGHAHTHTVIFLHGRGDDAEKFMAGLQGGTWLDSQRRTPMDVFPTFRWVFPTAGVKPCARPGGPQAMSQWFDMWDHLNLGYREDMQAPGLREGVCRVRAMIASETGRLGGRYDKIVLMGISQGGATSVHALLNLHLPEGYAAGLPRRLGALVGVACRMPFPERSLARTRTVLGLDDDDDAKLGGNNSSEMVRNTPVMLEHSTDDPTVLVHSGKELRQTLQGFGALVTWREYPQGGHWFKSPEGLDDLATFLHQVLSP